MTTYVVPAGAVSVDGTTITGNGTGGSPLAVVAGGIGATQLGSSAVTAAKIANGAVGAAQLGTGAVDGKTIKGGGGAALAFNATAGNEVELTTTGATTIATVTPAAAGDFLVTVYFRVTTAATTMTVSVSYSDVTGAETFTWLSAVSEPAGSYALLPFKINSVASAAITVSATAGTANQAFVTATILPIA